MNEILSTQWMSLFEKFSSSSVLINKIFEEVIKYYNQPHRYYHNLKHIQEVLQVIDTLNNNVCDLYSLKIAAWFHDLIYNPQETDNEEKSTQLASTYLTQLNIPQSTINTVNELILSTKYHQPSSEDSKILVDADLSILGANLSKYNNYCRAIRWEYSWLNNQDYCQGRKKVLENFLQRKQIYYTPKMYQLKEKQARINLLNELKHLSSINQY
jgi:predicted metal-dependent HD superfamily phosphohydrolase